MPATAAIELFSVLLAVGTPRYMLTTQLSGLTRWRFL